MDHPNAYKLHGGPQQYLGILPTIKKSPLAVASMEMGNVPFTEATHPSIILSHLPVAWRNQYNLTHSMVPESLRAMQIDLENIEKLFVKKYNKKAKTNKAKAATASKMAERVPKKRTHGGGPDQGAPKKGLSAKNCKWCKAAGGKKGLSHIMAGHIPYHKYTKPL